MRLSRLPSPAAGRDLSIKTADCGREGTQSAGRVPAYVPRLSVRQTPSRSVARSLVSLSIPSTKPHTSDAQPNVGCWNLSAFGPLVVRTKPLRLLMPCLGMGSYYTTIMIIDPHSGSATTSSCLTHDPDDDPAACGGVTGPLFRDGRGALRRVLCKTGLFQNPHFGVFCSHDT